MAPIDPFSAEIVRLVRSMPDNAILALVKNQLGNVPGAAAAKAAVGRPAAGRRGRPKAAAPAAAPAATNAARPAMSASGSAAKKPGRKPGRKPAAAAPGRKPGVAKAKPGPKPKAAKAGNSSSRRGGGRSSAGRQELLSSVERVVKGGNGLSASEIAKSAGVPQTRVTSALKELKLAKRIYQGGDRRFARYAGDARAAEQASVAARQNASGPLVKKGKRK